MQSKILAFFIGLGAAIQIGIVGTIAVSELLCLLILVLQPKLLLANQSALNKLLAFGLLWMVGVVLSDLVNFRPLEDTIKALGAIFFLLVSTVIAFSLLAQRAQLILFFAIGLGFSYALQYFYFPSSVMRDLLEQGLGQTRINEIYFAITFFPLAMCASGLAWSQRYRLISLLILSTFGALALSFDRRSIFLVCILSVAYLSTVLWERRRLEPLSVSQRRRKTVLQLLAVFGGLIAASQIYEYSASQGFLGEGARSKYESQAGNEALGMASGRQDFFEGIYGALERPLLGFGSYAPDSTGVRKRFADAVGLPPPTSRNRGLPGHSHIVGAWLFAGALSLPFWVYAIKILGSFILRATASNSYLIGFSIPFILYALWNIFFSPFSNRIELGFALAFAMILTPKTNRKASASGARRSQAIKHTRLKSKTLLATPGNRLYDSF